MRLFASSIIVLAFAYPAAADAARLWSSGCEFQSDTPNAHMYGAGSGRGLDFPNAISGTTTTESLTVYTDIKRSGLSSCRVLATTDANDLDGSITYYATQVATDVYYRFYLYIVTAPAADAGIMSVVDWGVDGIEGTLVLEADRQLHWSDDDGTTDGQGTTVLNLNQWYRIEVNYDAADQVLVYIDGVQEFDSGAHDGDSVDGVSFGLSTNDSTAATTGEWLFDDFAINDTSGSDQTGLPGAGSIVYMQPDGAGDNNGCSSGDSTSVDELTPDNATTICVLDAASDILDVTVESTASAGIGSSDTITLIQVGATEAGATASSHNWATRIKSASGGTTSAGSSKVGALASYNTNNGTAFNILASYSLTSYTDPTTAVAWTPTGTNSIDNMQIGITTSDATPDVHVTAIWALVEFIPAEAPPASTAPDAGIIWFE